MFAYCNNNPVMFDDPDGYTLVNGGAKKTPRLTQRAVFSPQAQSRTFRINTPPRCGSQLRAWQAWRADQFAAMRATAPPRGPIMGATPTAQTAQQRRNQQSIVYVARSGPVEIRTPENNRQGWAFYQVKSNPQGGTPVNMREPMKDSRWPAADGWIKMAQSVSTSQGVKHFHYVFNTNTGVADDFKIISITP